MSLLEKIQHIIEKRTNKNDRFLLAVSGGKDSMALFSIFSNLNLDFAVAHMNYGLREEESDKDELLVRKVAEERKVKLFTKKVDTKTFCSTEGYSTQEGARILRYSWFQELLDEEKIDWIVTAHHEEDNKETFIQNLKRGSGLRGLKSMKVIHENRFKPLLSISRSEIDSFVEENQIKYRQDASNNQNHYQRNLIRNKLLPTLEEELPGIGLGITSSIENLRLDYEYLVDRLERESTVLLVKEEIGWKIKDFKNIHPRLLFHILEKFEFNIQQMYDILGALSGKKIENDQYEVTNGHGDLYLQKISLTQRINEQIKEPGVYNLGDQKVHIQACEYPTQFDRNKSIAYVDADKLFWPLTIRNYRQGDKIKPIGLSGSKKLSDYFTDQKIPVHLRSHKMVILSGDEIIWIVGEMVSDKVKLTESTKKVLKFETYH